MLAPCLLKLATKLPKLALSCFQYGVVNVFAFFLRDVDFLLFFQFIWNDFYKLLNVFEVEIQCFQLDKKPFFCNYSFLLTFGCILISQFITNEKFEQQVGL